MNPPDTFETVQLVELSALTDLARLGAAMRRAQKAYFAAARGRPHSPPKDELVAARDAEAKFDRAVAAAIARERACLPGMEGGRDRRQLDPLNPASAAYQPEYPDGATLIAEERERQQREKGYTAERDDQHVHGELAMCAELVMDDVLAERDPAGERDVWPDQRAVHVRNKYARDHVRRLTIAGALIAAEIDRLLRRAERKDAKQASPTGRTYGELYGPAMQITDQGQAESYFAELVRIHLEDAPGDSRERAEEVQRVNLGYYAGYYDHDTRARVERLFNCAHPIYGAIAERGEPT